jgi:hypothetical protein
MGLFNGNCRPAQWIVDNHTKPAAMGLSLHSPSISSNEEASEVLELGGTSGIANG